MPFLVNSTVGPNTAPMREIVSPNPSITPTLIFWDLVIVSLLTILVAVMTWKNFKVQRGVIQLQQSPGGLQAHTSNVPVQTVLLQRDPVDDIVSDIMQGSFTDSLTQTVNEKLVSKDELEAFKGITEADFALIQQHIERLSAATSENKSVIEIGISKSRSVGKDLETTQSRLKGQMDSCDVSVTALSNGLKDYEEDLQGVSKGLTRLEDTTDSHRSEVNEKISGLQDHYHGLQKDLVVRDKATASRHEELKRDHHRLRSRAEKSDEGLKRLGSRLDAMETREGSLRSENAALRERVGHLETTVRRKQDVISGYEAVVAEVGKIAPLVSTVASLEASASGFVTADAMQSRLGPLMESLQDVGKIGTLETKLAGLDALYASKNETLTSINVIGSALRDTRGHVAQHQTAIKNNMDVSRKAEERIANNETAIASGKDALDELKTQVDAQRVQATDFVPGAKIEEKFSKVHTKLHRHDDVLVNHQGAIRDVQRGLLTLGNKGAAEAMMQDRFKNARDPFKLSRLTKEAISQEFPHQYPEWSSSTVSSTQPAAALSLSKDRPLAIDDGRTTGKVAVTGASTSEAEKAELVEPKPQPAAASQRASLPLAASTPSPTNAVTTSATESTEKSSKELNDSRWAPKSPPSTSSPIPAPSATIPTGAATTSATRSTDKSSKDLTSSRWAATSPLLTSATNSVQKSGDEISKDKNSKDKDSGDLAASRWAKVPTSASFSVTCTGLEFPSTTFQAPPAAPAATTTAPASMPTHAPIPTSNSVSASDTSTSESTAPEVAPKLAAKYPEIWSKLPTIEQMSQMTIDQRISVVSAKGMAENSGSLEPIRGILAPEHHHLLNQPSKDSGQTAGPTHGHSSNSRGNDWGRRAHGGNRGGRGRGNNHGGKVGRRI